MHALDNFRDPFGSMVAGNRQLLHARRIYPFVACACGRRASHSIDFGPSACLMTRVLRAGLLQAGTGERAQFRAK